MTRELKLDLEKNLRLNAEKEVVLLQAEVDCIRKTAVTKDSIEDELQLMITRLTQEKESILSQLNELRKFYEERQVEESVEIIQLKSNTSVTKNAHISLESELMHAKNVIVQLESNLRAAEEQMKFYIEIDSEHKHHADLMAEEFTCMEKSLRASIDDNRQHQDRIISLETENGELRAAVKVEKMLRLKNFQQFSNDNRSSCGFESPSAS